MRFSAASSSVRRTSCGRSACTAGGVVVGPGRVGEEPGDVGNGIARVDILGSIAARAVAVVVVVVVVVVRGRTVARRRAVVVGGLAPARVGGTEARSARLDDAARFARATAMCDSPTWCSSVLVGALAWYA